MQQVGAREQPGPRVRHKVFDYATRLAWSDGRSGTLSAEGRPDLAVSSPPEFRGEPGRWTPEHLFVAAIEICTMTTFAALAERAGLEIRGYASEASGRLERVEGGFQFTRVVLRLRIALADPAAREAAAKVLEEAHEACLIGRSIRAEVVIEPEFVVG
jgi:organic hydroperoxide reductase OsmC/OhrA